MSANAGGCAEPAWVTALCGGAQDSRGQAGLYSTFQVRRHTLKQTGSSSSHTDTGGPGALDPMLLRAARDPGSTHSTEEVGTV